MQHVTGPPGPILPHLAVSECRKALRRQPLFSAGLCEAHFGDSWGFSRSGSSAVGLVASRAVKGSRNLYVCVAPMGTVQERR